MCEEGRQINILPSIGRRGQESWRGRQARGGACVEEGEGETFTISAQEGCGGVAGIMCWDEVGLTVTVPQ